MGYQILPNGKVWADGVFCLPKSIVNSLRLIGADNLQVLTYALGCDGEIKPSEIASALKIDEYEVIESLDFWVSEGILTDGKELNAPSVAPAVEQKPALERLPMPTLTPKDIVALCRESNELTELLRNAEKILASQLSNSMKSNLINMVTYYGLNVPVVLTLLQYYKNERDKGKGITMSRVQKMAQEWAETGVDDIEKASQKLQEIEDVNELWGNVINLCEMEYKKPTQSQSKMLLRWRADFNNEMINFAVNTMKKYNEKESWSIKEIDNILKDWKRKGCATPDEVKAYKKPEQKSTKNGKLKSKPSFDINEIAKQTALNDDYDI